MFNVRPDALSPWLYVEQPPEDEPLGFRVAPDGSVMDAKRIEFSAPAAPPIGTDFEDAIRHAAGGLYGPADLAVLPRDPVQQALDEIAMIYAGLGTKPSNLLDRQAPSADMATPVGGRLPSPSAIESSLMSPRVEQSTLASPVSHIEGGRLPMMGASFSSPIVNLRQTDPQLAPAQVLESQQASDDQGSFSPWAQTSPPSQLGGEALLGRTSSDIKPMSLPAPTTGAGVPSAVFDDSISVGTTPADDVQIAQAPRPQQRTQKPTPNPKTRELDPPASEQKLQVNANTQLVREVSWEDLIRQPLPRIGATDQQPLPDDWEAFLTKISPTYLKWTKAAAEKHGIPPELLARLFYKESNFNKSKQSGAGAKGIAQLTSIAVEALGLDSKKFDYFDAEKSINAGATLLAMYHREFKNWHKAVAAYNMGNTAVRQWFAGEPNATSPRNAQTRYLLQHVFRGDPHAFNKR